jgi:hypothetical protein
MQFIGSSRHFVNAFAIALPSITVFFAFLVFNLETILCAFSTFSENSAYWLRKKMRGHRRRGWKARAVALQEDESITKAPVRRATKQSSGWMYVFFVLEFLFVTLPVAEIVHFLNYSHVRPNGASPSGSNHQRNSSLTAIERGDETVLSEAERRKQRTEMIKEKVIQSVEVQKRKEQEQRELERGALIASYLRLKRGVRAKVKPVLRGISTVFRTIFMMFGIVLLLIEYAITTAYLFFRPSKPTVEENALSSFTNSPPQSAKPAAWKQAYEILGFDAIYPLCKQDPPGLDQHERRAIVRAATMFIPPSSAVSRAGTQVTAGIPRPYEVDDDRHMKMPMTAGVRRVGTARNGGSLRKGSEGSETL